MADDTLVLHPFAAGDILVATSHMGAGAFGRVEALSESGKSVKVVLLGKVINAETHTSMPNMSTASRPSDFKSPRFCEARKQWTVRAHSFTFRKWQDMPLRAYMDDDMQYHF